MKKQTKGKFKNIKSTVKYVSEEQTTGPLALSGGFPLPAGVFCCQKLTTVLHRAQLADRPCTFNLAQLESKPT